MAVNAAPTPFPERPEDRLRLALRSLQSALEEQEAAVAAFRGEIFRLGRAVQGLESSVVAYRGRLSECALDLAEARDQARRLERTVSRWPGG